MHSRRARTRRKQQQQQEPWDDPRAQQQSREQDPTDGEGRESPQPQYPTQVCAQTSVQDIDSPTFNDASADDAQGLSSPKMAMFCPQPRRIFAPRSSTPSIENPPGSPWSAHDEACNELRELLGTKSNAGIIFDAGQALDQRPLSSVSTSAGPTPSPDDRVCTPVPGQAETPQPPILEEYDDEWGIGQGVEGGEGLSVSRENDPEGVRERPGFPAQVRKVFVGGVPQNMNQDDLFSIFNSIAGVKKAWLQRHRTAGTVYSTPPRNHRGFGFVIFHDGNAVEKLLGRNSSCFLMLSDGRKLEVKRAVSSGDMATPSNNNGSTSQPAPQSPAPQGVQASKPVGSPWRPGEAAWPIPASGSPPPLPALPSVPAMPTQQAAMSAAAPWPASSNGSMPAVMQAPQAYPGVPGVYVGTTASPHPGILLQPRAGAAVGMPHEDQSELVMQVRTQIMLTPGHPVCEQVGGAMIPRQPWVIDPSSQAAMQMAMGQARVPTPVPPVLSPQPVLASWAPASASHWGHINAASGAVPPQQAPAPSCAAQWVQGHADMRSVTCSPALPEGDAQPPLTEKAGSSSGGASAPVVLPGGLAAPESQQQSSYKNNKELESFLLQAMPDYYDD
uniref:RRM domain-containing protein n=1 Tax=Alexandrium monilatum TaxID=311494 RepID=A0A7S4Q1A2_9DINO